MSRQLDDPEEQNNSFQVSLCIPSSAISETNTFNLEQTTHVAYQIAKAATLYNVSEIIVLDIPKRQDSLVNTGASRESQMLLKSEGGNMKIKFENSTKHDTHDQSNSEVDARSSLFDSSCSSNNAILLASLLQYFITPKYLVKSVFQNSSLVKKFRYAEKLPTLSSLPSIMSGQLAGSFREGFTVSKRAPKIRKKNKNSIGVKKLKVTKYVNIGESRLLELNCPEVPTNVRVTVDLKNKKIVNPQEAYKKPCHMVTYGFYVRLAKKVSSVFTEFSSSQGYTESIFVNANNFFCHESKSGVPKKTKNPKGQLLVMIGNMPDLNDFFKQEMIEGVEALSDMFDSEIHVPLGLRIEDAALVSLTMLHHSQTKINETESKLTN